MTPTSFAFTITMPGDERFVGAIRLLAAQTASYANLSAEAGEALAGEVGRATEALVQSTGSRELPIEFAFSGDANGVSIQLACTAAGAATPPPSTAAEGVTVNWTADGARLTCSIHQPTAA
jgi:hypothetical protein